MKKVKLIVKKNSIIELAEDAKKGDIIDLENLNENLKYINVFVGDEVSKKAFNVKISDEDEKNQRTLLEKFLYIDGFTAGLIVCGIAAIILLAIKYFVLW